MAPAALIEGRARGVRGLRERVTVTPGRLEAVAERRRRAHPAQAGKYGDTEAGELAEGKGGSEPRRSSLATRRFCRGRDCRELQGRATRSAVAALGSVGRHRRRSGRRRGGAASCDSSGWTGARLRGHRSSPDDDGCRDARPRPGRAVACPPRGRGRASAGQGALGRRAFRESMLALKAVLARARSRAHDDLDEVDSGIGGRRAGRRPEARKGRRGAPGCSAVTIWADSPPARRTRGVWKGVRAGQKERQQREVMNGEAR